MAGGSGCRSRTAPSGSRSTTRRRIRYPSVLASPYVIKGTLTFKLHITLLTDGKPDAVESYFIDFQG